MKGNAALKATGIDFTYNTGIKVLNGVDFCANSGDFVALLASNGSGKTTLLKVLAGLLKPQNGSVYLNNRDISKLHSRDIYSTVGVVMQNPQDQLFGPTVEDDIAFGPRNLKVPEEEVTKRVDEALDAVGLPGLHDRAVHHLSFGQQKRVSIAGALAMHPSILVLDEPTAGLDPLGETNMIRLLHRLNRESGLTILLATHSIDMLPLFATKIVVLSGGTVCKEGDAETIFGDQEMLAAAGLRLPYVSQLFDELRMVDGFLIDTLPLTIGEAKRQLLDLIQDIAIVRLQKDKGQ